MVYGYHLQCDFCTNVSSFSWSVRLLMKWWRRLHHTSISVMIPFNLHYCRYTGWQKELPLPRVVLVPFRCGLEGRNPTVWQKPGDRGGGALKQQREEWSKSEAQRLSGLGLLLQWRNFCSWVRKSSVPHMQVYPFIDRHECSSKWILSEYLNFINLCWRLRVGMLHS
jgi:hypothetical protein